MSVAVVTIAAAMFKLLAPEHKFKKQIGVLISCFFMLSVLKIVSGQSLSLDADAAEITAENPLVIDFTQKTIDYTQRQAAKELSQSLYALLEENGVRPKQIYVNINISNLYSISINEVRLVFPDGEDEKAQKALEITKNAVGENITVTLSEE